MKNSTNVLDLFKEELVNKTEDQEGATAERLKRLDFNNELKDKLMPFCRLKEGGIWKDPISGHKVGVLDAVNAESINNFFQGKKAKLIVNDPPYNVSVGNVNTKNLFKIDIDQYIQFSRSWVKNAIDVMDSDGNMYTWLGLDYKDNFQPLPDFILMMREFKDLKPKNIITMRNQRGYGTQKNWMWVRQELLYYIKGNPEFHVKAEYTDIPKILRGYYKKVNGKITSNFERSKSNFIRAGNVWVDVQQVFYRMEENVPGCYAQKPLLAIERIINSGSREKDIIADFFAHSGTTLIAGEKLGRIVYTFDIDPVFAEITIRRLERFRKTGKTGWQWNTPFPELESGRIRRWI